MSAGRTTTAQTVARALLAAGAVTLRPDEPFTWASGLRAPIYCDNRLALALPAARARIAEALAESVRQRGLSPDAVAGVATAGIPQATLLADRLQLPLAYVRAAAKGHGQKNRIEGRVEPGWRLVLVEDLVSTGGSAIAAVEALREAGAEVDLVLAVFTYGLPAATAAFEAAGVELAPLADLDALLGEAAESLTEEQRAAVRAWREDPEGWSRQRG
jgi:orotate phosphoribosyltransferase